jgi:hypothetical protein
MFHVTFNVNGGVWSCVNTSFCVTFNNDIIIIGRNLVVDALFNFILLRDFVTSVGNSVIVNNGIAVNFTDGRFILDRALIGNLRFRNDPGVKNCFALSVARHSQIRQSLSLPSYLGLV